LITQFGQLLQNENIWITKKENQEVSSMAKKRGYDSKLLRVKHVDKNLEHIRNIRPVAPEPQENREAIDGFFREKKKDEVWKKRRKIEG
jgi:hypothetical protein